MKNIKTNLIAKVTVIVYFFLTFYFLLSTFNSNAQGGVSINNTGGAANNSAMLDVSGASQGVLINRMTTLERDAIATPIPESLLIYNTTTKCFETYVGTTWQSVVCGCTTVPAAAGTISGTATVCPGQNAVLYSVSAITGASSYIWSYSGTGAFIVGSSNAAIVYFSGTATSGNLTVMGTNACGNGTVSANYPIAVNSTAPNITAQPESVATCLGSGAVTFTVTASGGLTYQWQEYTNTWNNVANAGVYSNATTATLTITNPPIGMNAYKYRCVVSGTCTNTTSDGVATLTVNPVPSVTNSNTTTICSSTSPNITLTSSVPSNFSWTIGTITGSITGASSSSGTTINQTLTNPSNATAGSVQYIVTPTSTSGSCVGAAFTITVTVNPTPTVTNTPLTQSICSGASTTLVTLTSDVSGATFAWTASPTAGISGYTSSGSATIPVQTISNSNTTAGTVTYAITPTANSCTGTVSNYITTVNPLPASPTATAATGITSTKFTANWNTVAGSTSYLLDISTVSNFASFFGTYNGLNVGNVLSNNITGLTAATTYYYRVRALNTCGTGGNSNTITTTTMNIASSLVSYWKMDESSGNISDIVGSNTGVNSNVTYAGGKINNCGNLNGSSSYYTISNLLLSNTKADYSISFWGKINTTGGAYEFINDCNNSNYAQKYRVITNGSSIISFISNNDNTYTTSVTSTTNPLQNVWYHVAVIFSSNVLYLYINGTLEAQTNYVNNSWTGTSGSSTIIGKRISPGGNYNFLNGYIDEIGVWSRALTSTEVTTLYNSGAGLQYPF